MAFIALVTANLRAPVPADVCGQKGTNGAAKVHALNSALFAVVCIVRNM
jgi:hypothetical protein